MKTCDNCKFLGGVFDHLNGFNGVGTWRQCNAPVPWWDTPEAAPMVVPLPECKAHQPLVGTGTEALHRAIELLESAIMDFEKLKPLIGDVADAVVGIYKNELQTLKCSLN